MIYRKIFQELQNREIEYLVAGGMAVNFHGYIRNTMDLDILLLLDSLNVDKFIAMVKELELKPRIPVSIDDFADDNKRTEWIEFKNLKAFCVYNPKNEIEQIDVLIDPKIDFEKLFRNKVFVDIFESKVPIVSLEDLIEMKEKVARPLDLVDVENLKKLKELDNE